MTINKIVDVLLGNHRAFARPDEIEQAKKWLLEFQLANELSLKELEKNVRCNKERYIDEIFN